MDDHPAVAGEMGRVFGAIRPAGTLVGTSALIHPDLRVEIEVDAIIGSAGSGQEAEGEAVSIDQMSS
jgi:enamine deaminase RidA (YjgF/YER057c/UK114 family)